MTMTDTRIRALFTAYREVATRGAILSGCAAVKIVDLCNRALEDIGDGAGMNREKSMRWIGFIQGILYCEDVYTVDELKNHSRPDYTDPETTSRYDWSSAPVLNKPKP